MRRAIRNSRLFAARLAIAGLIFLLPRSSEPATVTPATLSSWNDFVQQSKAGLAQDICSPEGLLRVAIGQNGNAKADLAGRPPQGRMIPVPSGLIHHWKGAIAIPNTRPSDVVSVLQDYDSYASTFTPAVIESRLVSRTQDDFTYQLKLVQRGFGVKAGLIGVFRSSYHQLSSTEGYSITEATSLDELESPGSSEERLVPFGASHGYVEKMFTIVRYREAGRGVYVEIETLTLSRGVPISVRWMISSVIQRFSRQTMTGTLESIRDKVRATEELSASGERPRSETRGGW